MNLYDQEFFVLRHMKRFRILTQLQELNVKRVILFFCQKYLQKLFSNTFLIESTQMLVSSGQKALLILKKPLSTMKQVELLYTLQ